MVEIWSMGGSPPCRAVVLTAKALDIDHTVTELDLMKKEQLKPEFVAVNPAHCVPTIRDGELVLWESRAIQQYFCNKYAPESDIYPNDPSKRATVDFLLMWDMGTLYKAIADYAYPVLFSNQEMDKSKLEAYEAKVQFLNDHLIKGSYLTGETMTIADISISYSLTMPTLLGFSYEKYEKVNSFIKKMGECKKWQEVNAPFEAWKAHAAAQKAAES